MSYDLSKILKPHLTSAVEALRAHHREKRRYQSLDFPLAPQAFATFKETIVSHLRQTHGMRSWEVSAKDSKENQLLSQCHFEKINSYHEHGVDKEVHLLTLEEFGLTVPAVICLPQGKASAPGICCFSGHTPHGLKDLVSNLESDQGGIATRLAQHGFMTVAVEKIDAGFLSRDFESGADEMAIASFNLAHGCLTRSIQLKACLAAMELLAAHPRTDQTLMGSTGVSLGGWLCVESSLFTDRIKAIADFGMKTIFADPETPTDAFTGISDWCHIIPGLLAICDRNLHGLAAAPVKMLAGHGNQEETSENQGYRYYRDIHRAQYEALDIGVDYEYHVHDGGDTMPSAKVIDWFTKQFWA